MLSEHNRKFLVVMAIVIMGATAFAGCFGSPPPPPQNLKPFATATVGKSVVLAGEAVPFTGQATDPDQGDSVKSWRWDWGDGTNTTGANLSTATHTYTVHGTYYVNLNVSDTHDATYDTIATPLRVEVLVNFPDTKDNREPVAVLILWSDTTVIKPGTSINWGAQGSRGSWNASYKTLPKVVTYAMDYGDGTAVETHDNVSLETGNWTGNFTHTYNTGGKFVAKLTVTTNESKTDSTMWTVIVLATAPTPGLKNPTTFTHLTFGQPNNLDPAIAYDSASGEVIQQVYETLITYNGASADQFVPLLATEVPTVANGGISADGLNYTFHLKAGVKFHSGHTMDADDVVYSFARVLRMNWP